MDSQNKTRLLDEFSSKESLYRDFSQKVRELLELVTSQDGLTLHTVTCRAKSKESLKGKFDRPDKSYDSLSDITDLAGVRITTYFAEDVDKVAGIIKREFMIDEKNSVDKRQAEDPTKFGYASLHYICEFMQERCGLPEYRKYRGLKVEVQVRSILQHAWAEIEHDLGYKNQAGVPTQVTRRFASLAGLLEIADREFAALRKELDSYEATIEQMIQTNPTGVGIDKVSLKIFAKNNERLSRLEKAVSDSAKVPFYFGVEEYYNNLAARLLSVGIKNIAQLQSDYASNESMIIKFMTNQIIGSGTDKISIGSSMMFLAVSKAVQTLDREKLLEFVIGERNMGQELASTIADGFVADWDKYFVKH